MKARHRSGLFAACIAAAGVAFAADLAQLDAYANHNAFIEGGAAPILRLVTGTGLRLDASSSRPRASLAMLYDGERGRLDRIEATFLAFDGARAALAWDVPAWRRPDRIDFTALEPASRPADVRLWHEARGASRELPLKRTVLERRGDVAVVRYASGAGLALPAGRVRLAYAARGQREARLGEFSVDGIGAAQRAAAASHRNWTLDALMSHSVSAACPRVRDAANAGSVAFLKSVLPAPHAAFPTRLVYWRVVRDERSAATTHSMILQVDDTGNLFVDLVRAWLVVPDARRALPLVVLPQQGHIYGGEEPLGVQGETELAVAGELARSGIASLALDSAVFGSVTTPFQYYYDYYPDSGSTAKDLDNLRRALDQALDRDFQSRAGLRIDRSRIGVWGFSYGAWISMLAGALDPRFGAVALSSFHYHDRDIAPGLSASLYIPQLACFDPGATPISVPKILAESRAKVLAVVPDAGLLGEWTAGQKNPRVDIVVNPFGHVVTARERSAVLDFFYGAFAIAARAPAAGPAHDLPRTPEAVMPYVERENRWRAALLRALAAP